MYTRTSIFMLLSICVCLFLLKLGYPQFTHGARSACMWVVVKIMVLVWVLNIVRHLIFRITIILTTTHV